MAKRKGVGKTCLVRKFTQGIFPPGQSATIGVDFMIKTIRVGNEKIKVLHISFLYWLILNFIIDYSFKFGTPPDRNVSEALPKVIIGLHMLLS